MGKTMSKRQKDMTEKKGGEDMNKEDARVMRKTTRAPLSMKLVEFR